MQIYLTVGRIQIALWEDKGNMMHRNVQSDISSLERNQS